MDITTIIVGGALVLLLVSFVFRLVYTIVTNMVKGRQFHQVLEQEFNKLRLSNMLSALGINKTEYIYKTRVKDIHQQMSNCSDCTNTDECDVKLSTPNLDLSEITFCNNEEELIEIKRNQAADHIKDAEKS